MYNILKFFKYTFWKHGTILNKYVFKIFYDWNLINFKIINCLLINKKHGRHYLQVPGNFQLLSLKLLNIKTKLSQKNTISANSKLSIFNK